MVLTSLFKLIAPPFCAACRIFLENDTVLCNHCMAQIRSLVVYPLELTDHTIMMVHAVGAYNQPLVSLILAKSYGNRTVAYQLGKLLIQRTVIPHVTFDYIVPIPLHWSRYAWRGYNQAEEIANVIATQMQKPVAHLLKRNRRTSYQSHYKGAARFHNVKDVFTLREIVDYKDKHILLVDDVMTSGATLQEAAKILVSLRPASITAVVIARVP